MEERYTRGNGESSESWCALGIRVVALGFAIVVDVVMESVRNGLISEMLYVDDLVLMSETMEGLRLKFWKWKEALKSKGLKVNLGRAEGEMSVNKVDPCGICGKQVMANSVFSVVSVVTSVDGINTGIYTIH